MATAVKTQSSNASKTQEKQTTGVPSQEPKRLSKFALWRRENPNGIIEYVDWRAVNR
jgi:hypothetical protein